MTTLPILDDLRIATPCDAKWSDMRGGTRVRLCLSCDKNVYNFEEMTRSDIADLVVATEGKFCGRLFKRTDGTLLTKDCPLGLRERTALAAHRLALTVFLAAMALALFVLGMIPKRTCGVSMPSSVVEPNGEVHELSQEPSHEPPLDPSVLELEHRIRKAKERTRLKIENTMPRPGGIG